MPIIRQDLTGRKFKRLTVVKKIEKGGWECLCDCGNTTIAKDSHSLTSGKRKSCGCINKPHGRHGEKIYKIWKNMRARCNCVKSSGYNKYGARGVKVAERWSNFLLFVEDMGEMPTPQHSIERIDPNGNYEPSNCKWIPLDEQKWNKSSSRIVEYKGIRNNLNLWAQEFGVTRESLRRCVVNEKICENKLSALIERQT